MTPGIWTSYFVDLSPEDMVRQFAAKDWRHLELSSEHAAKLLERGDPAAVGEAFRTFAQDHGVTFPQGHLWLDCDIAGQDQSAIIDGLKRWLDLFVALGIRAPVLHPGGKALLEQGVGYDALLEARVRGLRPLAEHVQGTGVIICLENLTIIPFARDLIDIIKAVGVPNLGICFDTGHLHIVNGVQRWFIEEAGPYLKALHIADNDGSGDQHLMPYGRGTVYWDGVMAALRRVGYGRLFNLEIPGENGCPIPVRLAKLDYLKSVVRFMFQGSEQAV